MGNQGLKLQKEKELAKDVKKILKPPPSASLYQHQRLWEKAPHIAIVALEE